MADINSSSPTPVRCFGVFQINLAARELRKHGVRIRLPGQPFNILSLLLEKPGEVVTREEMRQRLWPADTFVDFEHSLNSAIKKLRAALSDSPENSRYIETVPRVGYRFIAPVTPLEQGAGGHAITAGQTGAFAGEATPDGSSVNYPHLGKTRAKLLLLAKSWVALVVVLGLLATIYLLRPTVPPPTVLRIRQLTHLGTVEAHQNLVTDGPRVYFRDRSGGVRSLKYVASDGGEAYRLPNSSSEFDIDGISPDGSRLLVSSVFIAGNDPVWALPTGGGGPQRLGNTMAIDAEWSSDGRKLAYMTAEGGVYIADADGGESRKLADHAPGAAYCPRWSPDSRRLRFVVVHSETGPVDLWEASTYKDPRAHALLPGWGQGQSEWGGSWSPDGRYFFFSSFVQGVKCVWALREKTDWWHKVSWVPAQLTAGPISYSLPRASRDGKTIFVVGEERRGELLRYDLTTRRLTPFLPKFSADHVSFSPDGQWMAYVQYPEGTLWRSKVDGTERRQLSVPPLRAYLPKWSPDAKWITFTGVADLGQPPRLFRVSANGLKPPEEFASGAGKGWYLDWSPDGNSVVFDREETADTPEKSEILVLGLKTQKIVEIPGSRGLEHPQWSPDGRHLVARYVGTKRLELYDFRSGQWSDLGIENAEYPSWSRDGRYIYFNTFYNSLERNIYRLRVGDRTLKKLYTLKDFESAGIYGTWSGVTPDGSPLLLRDTGTRDIYAIDVELP